MDLCANQGVLGASLPTRGKTPRPVQQVRDSIAAALAGQVSFADAVDTLLTASHSNFQSADLSYCLAPFAQASDGEEAVGRLADALAPHVYAADESRRVNFLTPDRLASALPESLRSAFVSAWTACVLRLVRRTQSAVAGLRLLAEHSPDYTQDLPFHAAGVFLQAQTIQTGEAGCRNREELATALSADQLSRQSALLVIETAPARFRNAQEIVAALKRLAASDYRESGWAKRVLALFDE